MRGVSGSTSLWAHAGISPATIVSQAEIQADRHRFVFIGNSTQAPYTSYRRH